MRAIAAGLDVSYTTVTRHADVLGLYGNETVRSVYGLFEKVDASQCSKGVGLIATERGHEFARELGLVAASHARKAVRNPRVIAPREPRGRAR